MVINSSSASPGKQLATQGVESNRQNSGAQQLIEQAKKVDQDAITEGVGETPLANQEMPRVMTPAKKLDSVLPQMQTKTTMDSITRRYQANFEAMQDIGRTIDVHA